jgi:hypothetical protein
MLQNGGIRKRPNQGDEYYKDGTVVLKKCIYQKSIRPLSAPKELHNIRGNVILREKDEFQFVKWLYHEDRVQWAW